VHRLGCTDLPDRTSSGTRWAHAPGLRPKGKQPNSARVLNAWIAQAERQLGSDGGRLGWLVASTIATAALQQAVDELGEPLFLLKGGTLLQHRVPGTSRATTDLDGLIRGDIDAYLDTLDEVLQRPWGACQLRRGEVEVINVPNRLIKPRRFDTVVDTGSIDPRLLRQQRPRVRDPVAAARLR
jgi:hypothetical protein